MAAFTSTRTNESIGGNLRWAYGIFVSSGGATGGDIRTGLQKVYGMILQQKGTGVVASQASVNESFPVNDPVTIVTAANVSGYWYAWGV